MRRALLVLLLLAACTPAADGGPSTAPTTTAPTSTSPTTAPGTDPVCLQGDRPFATSGNAGTAVRSESDARRLGTVTWELHPECERVVLGFTTGSGAPSVDPPGMASAFVRESGVVRVSLGSEIEATAIDEQLVEGVLVDRVFVVREPGGDRFVDIHLSRPAFARVGVAGGPGRILVDVRPGGPDYAVEPIRDAGLLVVEYPAGTTAYPFSVSGYVTGRDPGPVEATLSSEGADPVPLRARVTETGRGWRQFVLLVPDGPTGEVTLTLEERIPVRLNAGP